MVSPPVLCKNFFNCADYPQILGQGNIMFSTILWICSLPRTNEGLFQCSDIWSRNPTKWSKRFLPSFNSVGTHWSSRTLTMTSDDQFNLDVYIKTVRLFIIKQRSPACQLYPAPSCAIQRPFAFLAPFSTPTLNIMYLSRAVPSPFINHPSSDTPALMHRPPSTLPIHRPSPAEGWKAASLWQLPCCMHIHR